MNSSIFNIIKYILFFFPRCDQPNVDGAVRPHQHLRDILAPTAYLPQPHRSDGIAFEIHPDICAEQKTVSKNERKKETKGENVLLPIFHLIDIPLHRPSNY